MPLSTKLVTFVSRLGFHKPGHKSSAPSANNQASTAVSSVTTKNADASALASIASKKANLVSTPSSVEQHKALEPAHPSIVNKNEDSAHRRADLNHHSAKTKTTVSQKTHQSGRFARWQQDWFKPNNNKKTKTAPPPKDRIDFDIPAEFDEGCFVWNEKDILGSGAKGTVFKGKIRSQGKIIPCAVKSIETFDKRTGQRDRSSQRELAVHARVPAHPKVSILLGKFEAPGAMHLALELAKCDLSDLLVSHPWPPVRALRITAQVLQGLACLHDNHIIHLDVKPANVLVRQGTPDNVFLADFGISVVTDKSGSYQALGAPGTLGFCAPEVLLKKPLTGKTDVFATAALAYRLLSGRALISGLTSSQLAMATMSLDTRRVFGARNSNWKHIGHGVEELLSSMLRPVAAGRPSAKEALQLVDRAIDSLLGLTIDYSQASPVNHPTANPPVATTAASSNYLVDDGFDTINTKAKRVRSNYRYSPRQVAAAAAPRPSQVWWA